MLTLKIKRIDGSKKITHFHDINKLHLWLNLYSERFISLEMTNSATPGRKMIFASKRSFDDFYKSEK